MLELRSARLEFRDTEFCEVSLCGKRLVADISGALYWPAEQALLVADLHLGKASAAAVKGRMLPPYEPRETLLRLAQAIDRFEPSTIISLGDSLHDPGAENRLDDETRIMLDMIQEGRRWIWIAGNHDPDAARGLGGEIADEITLEGITLRHEPRPGRVTHEIAAHMHPAARVSVYGHVVRRPCFVGNGRRLILPAFGVFTGGLNVLDAAFGPLFGNGGVNVIMLGQDGVYPVAPRLLRED